MLKINLHVLEPCNYRCKHCFAHFDNHQVLSVGDWKKIIDNCCSSMQIDAFNIAGGEPLMYQGLSELVKYISHKGKKVSIITNGSLMTEEWIVENAKYFETIGFSIDSFMPDTLLEMGRADCKGNYLSKERFSQLCKWIKQYNPDCKIKINTVVTAINVNEDMLQEIQILDTAINRWKIFKMDVFKNSCFDNSYISITQNQYSEYVDRNLPFRQELQLAGMKDGSGMYIDKNGMQIVVERTVTAAYIMIDANGYLVDDSQNDSYTKVCNCLEEDFERGFKRLPFNQELYDSRY